MAITDDIDALLPQTQCTRCGYSGCRPYAEAIAAGAADINQCPPGGVATIAALAKLLERPAPPLNPANGIEGPPLVAQIDEDACIGCARCLPPCPVDAILGAPKRMHTVIAGAVHRVRAVHRALPGRLHRDGAAGEPAGCAARARAAGESRTLRCAHRTRRRTGP